MAAAGSSNSVVPANRNARRNDIDDDKLVFQTSHDVEVVPTFDKMGIKADLLRLKAMLWKNWLLKICHPYVIAAEILLPTVVMLMLIVVRTRVDTTLHPAQPYIWDGLFVEVGKGGISPHFNEILQVLLAKGEM